MTDTPIAKCSACGSGDHLAEGHDYATTPEGIAQRVIDKLMRSTPHNRTEGPTMSTGTDAATILRQSLATLEAQRTALTAEIDGIEKALAALDGKGLRAWRAKRKADLEPKP